MIIGYKDYGLTWPLAHSAHVSWRMQHSPSGGATCGSQLHLEYFPKIKASGINHMVILLSVTPFRDYSDMRANAYEVAGHLRGADSLKRGQAVDEIKKVVSMKTPFEELRL